MKIYLTSLCTFVLALSGVSAVKASSAHDDASQSAYADGWDDGDNGGTGFGPWSLTFNGEVNLLDPIYGSDPHFIDGVGVGPLSGNQLGSPAFGLTTSMALNTSAAAEATRPFNEPMKIGQTFRIDIDGSALESPAGIGNLFELLGTDGVPRFTLHTSLGSNSDRWIVNGSNTSIPAEDRLSVSLRLNEIDSFSGHVSSLSSQVGTFFLNAPLSGTAGEAINGLRIATTGTGSSSDGARELFFNNLEVTRADVPEPTTLGLAAMMLGLCLAAGRR